MGGRQAHICFGFSRGMAERGTAVHCCYAGGVWLLLVMCVVHLCALTRRVRAACAEHHSRHPNQSCTARHHSLMIHLAKSDYRCGGQPVLLFNACVRTTQ